MARFLTLLFALWAGGAAAQCAARDFLTLPLPSGDPMVVAMEVAYPGLSMADGVMTLPDRAPVPVEGPSQVDDATRLTRATLGDQFRWPYPLDFDLTARQQPWADPGRLRNDAVFRALWFPDEGTARANLSEVRYEGAGVSARFLVTNRHCAATQLALALGEIAALGPEMDIYFRDVGGSFNWRLIAGTNRLSVHSFGAAVDVNASLGGYWRWSGEAEGAVGAFNNRLPEALVRAMERRGWIWGGKWHHYDGMHFEYRPELILYARLTGG